MAVVAVVAVPPLGVDAVAAPPVVAQMAAAMVGAMAMATVVATSAVVRAHPTLVSHARTPVTRKIARHAAHKPHARHGRRVIPWVVTRSPDLTPAWKPRTAIAVSHVVTLTTSNPQATPRRASRRQASPRAIAATSVAHARAVAVAADAAVLEAVVVSAVPAVIDRVTS